MASGVEEEPVDGHACAVDGAGEASGADGAGARAAVGFVGRVAEVARLRSALRRPPCVVIVRGEAGVGTSRLVDEVLAAPESGDWVHLRGACPDLRRDVPLAPIADALAGLPCRPDLALPSVTGVVATVVPELAQWLPKLPAAAADPQARAGLLRRGLRALLAAQGPTVLVVEDVHQADGATLDLLHDLLGSMPSQLRLVVTEHSTPGLPALGLRLPQHVLVEEITLRPWTADETREAAAQWLGERAAEPRLVELLHARTGGLPGVFEALLGAVCEGGAPLGSVVDAIRDAGVPLRLRRDLAQRRERFTDDAQRVVEAAAVVGRAISVGVLAEVADIECGRAEQAVDLAVRRAVLRADGPDPAFRHPLDRQAALEAVPRPRLARLSLRAARALHRGGLAPLADLAHLYLAAGRVREGLRYLTAAADRATVEGDYTAATSLYTLAIAQDPRAHGRIRTAAKLARTAQLARADERVVNAIRRVLDEDDPPPQLRGELRLQLGILLRNQSGGALDSLNEIARAIPDLEVSDPHTAVRAMLAAAIPSIKGWPVSRYYAWLERAETFAVQVTDPVARAAMAANRASALMFLGDRRAWAAAEELRRPASSAMEAAQYARGWTNLTHATLALGHNARAWECLERATAGLADSSSPYVEGLTQTARLVLAWHEGRWDGLHAEADHVTRLFREIPDLTAEAMLVRGLAALHVLGDVPRARRDLEEAARTTCFDTGFVLTASAAALARIHLEAGRPGQASDAVEVAVHRLERTGGWVWGAEVVPIAVEALYGSGQVARAHRLITDFAAGIADRDAPAAWAALTVCQARQAQAENRYGEAATVLAKAEEAWQGLRRPFDAARAAEAQGRCLLHAHQEHGGHEQAQQEHGGQERHGSKERTDKEPGHGDQEPPKAAVSVIHRAIETYRELGARWDIARCHRLLRRHDIVTTHRRGRLGYGDRLSPREQEVARLVAQGRANRDIAESLVLSTRTIEHHVASIMRKLNVTCRTDIAAAHAQAARLGKPGSGAGPRQGDRR
ncbi:helix-turn-helix transcriptional regulator [Streptomyces zagrosensis]|uniref:DNA-binding CsgD family transcriptional regulator n=1 Tax=Streptomyces zagrosensis TaxID=1042984 RepID=A0A7W9QA49_9ACTN|nr:LuxR family transcriptional regulator [Streptomyces zagrosensis]MBB5936445.1 DNA-binding CsgD family transcriptional regulator [Streptomyces zagrosensis]